MNDIKTLKVSEVTLPMVKAVAMAMLNGGAPEYTCTIGGQKVRIIK